MSDKKKILAVNGGKPVSGDALVGPAWPPLYDKTADKLRELYFSRKWSFNSEAEQDFETVFADYHDAAHGVYMVNGTATLECALAALGVGPGDEVIVPALTWPATAMAAHYVGANVVFVDIEPTTLCLDPVKVRQAITDRTKAIIPVHLYGSMADLEAILAIADQHGLPVVEDCAHMHGGKWAGRGVGSWGRVGSFSFQQTKTVASGEGGICLTNDIELAETIYRLKHIGYGRGVVQSEAKTPPATGLLCHNYRGTAFEATILLGQMDELADRVARYNVNRDRIAQRLADVPGVSVQARGRLATEQSYYCFCVMFDGEDQAIADIPIDRIAEAIAAEGLGMGKTYGVVYKHLIYNMPPERFRVADGKCEVAEGIGTDRVLCLGHQWLDADDETIDAIGEIIAKVVENAGELA